MQWSSLRVIAMGATLMLSLQAGVAQNNAAAVDRIYTEAKAAQNAGDNATAIAKYQEMIRIAPNLAPAYNNLGMLYLRTHDYAKAIETLKRVHAMEPKLGSATALLGMAYFESKDYVRAKNTLEATLKVVSNDNVAALLLAKTLIQLKEFGPAASQLERLSQNDPKNQEILYLLANSYTQLAKDALVRMNEINPNSVLVHETSGQMMEDMANYDGAIVEYKKAADMAPAQPGTHYKLGKAYWETSLWGPAMHEFQAELQNDPQNCDAHAKLGDIWIKQQSQVQAALEEEDKALSICPDLEQAHLDRGEALLALGQSGKALDEFKGVEGTDPDDLQTHFLLAKAYRAMGRTQDAEAELQIYSKLEAAARQHTADRAAEVIQQKNSVQ